MNPLLLRKIITALSGLFLCVFVVVHLSVNCLLLLPEDSARQAYNAASTFLRGQLLMQITAYVLYAAILLHIGFGLRIAILNRRAKPERYVVDRARENSSWASRNMGLLGILILVFLVVHLVQFWARIKLGAGAPVPKDADGHVDVFGVADELFQDPLIVALYTLAALPLATHLHHGFQSVFKTLGLYHVQALRLIAKTALVYAVVMGLGFGIIPLVMYFR